MDIARIVQQEAAWLAQQEGPVASQLVDTYQRTFLEIEQKLGSIKNPAGYTANQLRATQAQLGALIETMHTQHSDKLGSHVKAIYQQQLPREGTAWQTLEKTFGDPKLAKQFANIRPVPNQRAIKALITTQGISIKGFSDDLTREVRQVLAVSHARGEDSKQMVRRLRQVPNLPSCSPNRLRLIVRMETARSSNQAKIDHIAELQQQFPDKEFWLMVQDKVDKVKKTRNHWFSWAIHGTVRNVTTGEWFEVDSATMTATKAEYKRITGRKASDNGVLWQRGGVGRRGKTIPAHFWDRGVLVPWDPTWQGSAFGAFKHPQGPIIVQEPEPEAARQADSNPESQPAEQPQLPAAVTPEPDEISRAQNEPLKTEGIRDHDEEVPDAPKPLPPAVIQNQIDYNSLNRFQKEVLVFNRHESMKAFEERHEIVMTWDDEGVRQFVGTGAYVPELKAHVVKLPPSVQGQNLSHSHPTGFSFTLEDLFEASARSLPQIDAQGVFGDQDFAYTLEPPETGWPEFDEAGQAELRAFYQDVYSAYGQKLVEAAESPDSAIERDHVKFLMRHLAMVEISRIYGLKYIMSEVLGVPYDRFRLPL